MSPATASRAVGALLGSLIVAVGADVPGPTAERSSQREATVPLDGVVIDRTTGDPVPHAWVDLRPTHDGTWSHSIVTLRVDAHGRFRAAVEAGRYAVLARAAGYVDVPGAHRFATESQRWLTIVPGEPVTGLTVSLTRGASVSGVVRGSDGEPAAGVAVTVDRVVVAEAMVARVLTPQRFGVTDDRGRFRLWALPPGEYVLSTTGAEPFRPGLQFIPGPNDPPAETIAHEDVQLARASALPVQAPSLLTPPVRSGLTRSPSPPRPSAVASTFYPGVADAARAQPIVLTEGEARDGLDFQVLRVPVATLSGTVALPAEGVQPSVVLLSADGTDLSSRRSYHLRSEPGAFVFSGVPPGSYHLVALAVVTSVGTQEPAHWSDSLAIAVNGADLDGLTLVPRPGGIVSGRLRWTGAAGDAARVVSLRLMPLLADGPKVGAPPAEIGADGSLRWKNVQAGRYTVELQPYGRAESTALVSVTVDGRDVTNAPIDVSATGLDGLEVTLTNRAPSLSGALRTATGARASGWVVIFPIDARQWRARSGRVSGVFAGAGEYTFSALPPGEYWLATVPDLQPRQRLDPSFLESLRAGAVRVTLRDGDAARLDLQTR
jgi:hypothetical protein